MRGTAALITVTLLLSGCAGGAAEPASTTIGAMEPSQVATPSVEVSVAAEEKPQPPAMPALAREQTAEGAVAFAEWWFATLNYATATGDTTGLRIITLEECGTCSSLLAEIDGAYADGGRIRGGAFEAVVDSPGAMQERGIKLAAFVDIEATQFIDADGEVTATYEAEYEVMTFVAALIDGEWRAGGLLGTEV